MYRSFDSAGPPSLVEPGAKYHLTKCLRHCHQFKETYHNHIFNISIALALFAIVFAILAFKYKGKLTVHEKRKKEMQKQQYIFTKIKTYQDAKRSAQEQLITGLPHW